MTILDHRAPASMIAFADWVVAIENAAIVEVGQLPAAEGEGRQPAARSCPASKSGNHIAG